VLDFFVVQHRFQDGVVVQCRDIHRKAQGDEQIALSRGQFWPDPTQALGQPRGTNHADGDPLAAVKAGQARMALLLVGQGFRARSGSRREEGLEVSRTKGDVCGFGCAEHVDGSVGARQWCQPLHQRLRPRVSEVDHANRERKEKLQAQGMSYAFVDCFIYERHDLLETYTLDLKPPAKAITIGYYMVDFKDIFRVNCAKINRNAKAPDGMKILQLDVLTRQSLRNKLASYFGREPEEDRL